MAAAARCREQSVYLGQPLEADGGDLRENEDNGVRPHWNKGRKHAADFGQKVARPGALNGRWKGGRMIDRDGYVLIKRRDHPNANNSGYIREHRLVMEAVLGRYLRRDELVHHINANKQDN